MYTIWFSIYECPTELQFLKIDVDKNIIGIKYVQEIWDKLQAGGFIMKSARP
jgi:hypothetical protein